MVGTPKSNGCQTCRRRKKKCDERLPACSECVRGGWPCPGYDKRWKFVDENKQLARRHPKNGISKSGPSEVSGLPKTGERRLELYEAKKLGDAVSHVGIFWPLGSEIGRNATLFVSIIDNDMAQSLLPLQAVGSFLPAIPSRLGRNAALDAAVASLCSIYIDHLTVKSTGSNATLQKYIVSLNALQSCIKDPELRSQSETICASIIVQMCELLMSHDGGRWSGLNRGCALLIKDCDPKRFRTGFDRDLLDSQRNHFSKLTQAMHAGEECFLARPEWREVERAPTEPSAYGSEETRLKHMLSELLMDFPKMIRESADLVTSHSANRGWQDHPSCLQDVIYRQLQMKQELETWFATVSLKAGSDVGASDDQTLTTKPRYRNLFCGIVDCIVNSVLVKLDRMMLCLSTILHPTAQRVQGIVCDPAFLEAIENRRAIAREAFDFVKSTSDIGTKPLDFGLQMIATDDDVFEVPLPTVSGELGS
ncbi:hypothetical protein CONLIGDRAFT_686057 [Coniochaeta ligniaria NRRL 30616]|uniref:Zn(2)-C6 fungal-type domain-containing protein n=1 Tax=Coniochaeta ligniaria NRRL 30616 TaxID=1408157 RepID=A0A1J7J3S4_9PEZI|nr:hypothetical protein CONLIGDRAFT_686057 [Coniochaeta ligniaria NRRL 30616]